MIKNKSKLLINRVIELYSNNIFMRNIPEYIKNEFDLEIKVNYHDIRKILKENNISVNKENYRLWQKRSFIKEDYFNIDNNNTFYIAWFLLWDGHFSPNRKNLISIALQAQDINILYMLKKELQIEKPLVKKKLRNAYSLNFTSYQIRNDLNLKYFDIINKSDSPNINKRLFDTNYFFDFLRWLLDSDWCISISPNNYAYIRFTLTMETTVDISEFLKNKFNIHSKMYFINKKYNLYELRFTWDNSKKLITLLYNENSYFLKRKFIKILNTKNCPINKKLEELLESPKAL